ncbi:MAG: hypothetical protein QOH08_51 [Chloroflexota bacterium]|jgi:4-hydroxy-tetrahydrodipicolinate synthase|nr:hypothetical protein [Chloroflexota bacterium]
MSQTLRLTGAIPANLLPFNDDYSIDEPEYRKHLRWLADVPGVGSIVVNGHAAEVSALSRDERKRALAIAVDEVGSRVNVISGVISESTFEAGDLAADARAEGAAGVLVFPPALFLWGGNLRPEMAIAYYSHIADAGGLPIVLFQYPVQQGWGYTTELLLKLIEIEPVVAVKEWSQDIVVFERNLKAIRSTGRPVAVLSSFTASLYATFALGADGAISGLGSVAADLQAELFAAVQAGDPARARQLSDRHNALTEVFYAPPFLDMHNRMKEALVALGRIRSATVRPPLQALSKPEQQAIRAALLKAGLLPARRPAGVTA